MHLLVRGAPAPDSVSVTQYTPCMWSWLKGMKATLERNVLGICGRDCVMPCQQHGVLVFSLPSCPMIVSPFILMCVSEALFPPPQRLAISIRFPGEASALTETIAASPTLSRRVSQDIVVCSAEALQASLIRLCR